MRTYKKMALALPALLLLALCACGRAKEMELGGQTLPLDATELTLVLTEEELPELDAFSRLERLDLSGSDCYAAIRAWAAAHPEVAVSYTVAFPGGVTAENDAAALALPALNRGEAEETLALLEQLPTLRRLDLGQERADFAPEDAARFAEARPDLEIDYRFTLLGKSYALTDEAVDLRALGPDQVDAAARALAAMPGLKTVALGDGEREEPLTWEEIARLRAAAPQADFDYRFQLYGLPLTLDSEELDLSYIRIYDQGEEVRQVLRCMPGLRSLIMDSCGVDNEHMAAIREEFPAVEVVWRIWFGTGYSVRTDVEKILASKPSEGGQLGDREVQVLQYCTKVKYLDVGHNQAITDISFVSYMPDLEVAILALNPLGDLSPLASCTHLEYLEIFYSNITDLSPLAELKELRHLNIAWDFFLTDISPLYNLTQLERLWIGRLTPISEEQVEEMRRRAPGCEVENTEGDPALGTWRYTDAYDDDPDYISQDYYYPGLSPRYALLRQQLGYETLDYSFSWKDPDYRWW